MMEKDKLRKADVFSGTIIFLVGLWIVGQALKMPMKDSWGGVQNVWFVSPAIFPLFVGAMIMLLGALLVRTAMKAVGFAALVDVFRWLGGPQCVQYLKSPSVVRFYAMVVLLFSYVYLNIPRVDFFIASVLFLVVFITMFYLDDPVILQKMFFFYLGGTLICLVFFVLGLHRNLFSALPYAGDWLVMAFVAACCIYAKKLIGGQPMLKRKLRTSLMLGFGAPFLVGAIFKYFLLVPMPTEGLVVVVMDAIRYWDF